MSSESETIDLKKRRSLTYATTAVGAVGAAFLVGGPFVKSWMPNERAKNAGAPVEVDISKIEQGELLRVEWQGKPVWVLKRTETQMNVLKENVKNLVDPDSKTSTQQPEYAKNDYRSREMHSNILVLVGICTHLGCSPTFRPEIGPADLGKDWQGGFYCACHGSHFDLAGRVFKNYPAPKNLEVPEYYYKNDDLIVVGLSEGEA